MRKIYCADPKTCSIHNKKVSKKRQRERDEIYDLIKTDPTIGHLANPQVAFRLHTRGLRVAKKGS